MQQGHRLVPLLHGAYLRLLITVNLRLVRAVRTDTDVGCLFGRKTREVYAELFEM